MSSSINLATETASLSSAVANTFYFASIGYLLFIGTAARRERITVLWNEKKPQSCTYLFFAYEFFTVANPACSHTLKKKLAQQTYGQQHQDRRLCR